MLRANERCEPMLFTGNSNPQLARGIANYLGLPLSRGLVDRFPGGETHVELEDSVRGNDVFIIQSTAATPNSNSPNDNLMELLALIDASRRSSAGKITAVLPYFGYARQDRKDKPRVPVTASITAAMLREVGADHILTLDLHANQIQAFFDPIPSDILTAGPGIFLPHIRGRGLARALLGSADLGGVKLMEGYADRLGTTTVVVSKRRDSATSTSVTHILGEVEGQDVIFVDDIVSTAGSLCTAAAALKERGAGDIYAAITHGVLADGAMERIHESNLREVWVTDSIAHDDDSLPGNISVLSCASLIGEGIRRLHLGESVSELFNEGQLPESNPLVRD